MDYKWTKNLHNFRVNFCLCSIRKKILAKVKLLQSLWQTFACVVGAPPKNGVATKFMAIIRFFLLVYT